MRTLARVELALIALATGVVALAASALPTHASLGGLALVVASTLFGQGLVRDLWLLRHPQPSLGAPLAEGRPIVCVESGLGIVLLLVGLVLLAAGVSTSFALARLGWTGLVATTLLAGFGIKDLVLEARPLRLRFEPDHGNVILGWGRSAPRCRR